MEVSHSLTLNEAAFQQLPDNKKPHFIFEWLRFLDKVLVAAQKTDIKSCQQKLVAQLLNLLRESLGAPARRLLARCLATLFSVGDTFLLFDTVNKCNDIIKVKDDSPSFLPTRLAAICCLGSMYEKLGRMMGRSYEETVTTLIRSLKNAESQTRLEIMITLEKICVGMGGAAGGAVREVWRAARTSLGGERGLPVRAAAARTLCRLLPLIKLTPADLDAVAAACLRAAQNTDLQLRCAIAELLGALIASTQAGEATNLNSKLKIGPQSVQQNKKDPPKNIVSLDEALNLLMGAFLRGGTSFLKGEIIKSGSGVNREVRVCVTHAYVIFVQNMGSVWLERNMTTFLTHVLDLVANPKAASSHVDAVYSRKCINYILRNTLGKMLGEKAQASACREIIQIVVKQMNSIDFNPENAKDCNQETLFSQHLLVCALMEVGELSLQLGTSVQNLVNDPSLNMINAIFSVLEHPCPAARLAAGRCARCVCVALPAQLAPLLDACCAALDSGRPSPHHTAGYSAALAAILGAERLSPLGIPHGRGKVAFNVAEQLLRSAGQSSRLTAARTSAGWLIVGAICTLGVPVVRGLLPRMLLLWRNSFPRSAKELESEKQRGDAFTWQVTLEGRAGALSALHSLLIHCPSLVNTEDTAKRLTQPIEGAIAVLTNVGGVLRNYGGALKAPAALLRLRLFQAAAALGALDGPPSPSPAPAPPAAPLLRLLAAELAGAAQLQAATPPTGLLMSAMHPRDTILLGEECWIYDTDHAEIEEQLISPLSARGSGALEHDPCCLYRDAIPASPAAASASGTAAQPLGAAVIDAAVTLFPLVFVRAANKHRQQMLEHFVECIKVSKGPRQEAIQLNVYTALLLSLRTLAKQKSSLGLEPVKSIATELIMSGLSASGASVRAAAASCLGRLCACVGEAGAQALGERALAMARAPAREPHAAAAAAAAVALAGVLRARGGPVPAAALPALRPHPAAPQVWSIHALTVVADSSGPMFRSHVESTLNLALNILFSAPPYCDDLHRAVGRLLSALITVVGPELQVCTVSRFVCACAALCESSEGGGGARAEAIGCLQQLQMFAPGHISLHTIVPQLCRDLSSRELCVRRAALCCLRQLSQKEAAAVCAHASPSPPPRSPPAAPYCGVVITETGLPGALFAFLDAERDGASLAYARDTLTCCLLAAAGARALRDWLLLCKRVLTVRLEDSNNPDNDLEGEGDDDQAEFHAGSEQSTHPTVQSRWPTRVFAMECIQKLMSACEATGDVAHFDLVKAKEKLKQDPTAEYLSLHLSELVRMAFVAATGESDALRLCGLKTLQQIIRMYARAPEPDFPGHLLLEQYQAQVGAAVRAAFLGETASHVTAAACDVCSAWIGCGVARDINDLRRVHQLLVSSLDKLNTKGNTTLIYNENMATLEKLSILKAWAEVYIVAMISNGSAPGSYVKQLDTKPINVRAELVKWRNTLAQNNNNQTDNRDDDDYGEFESKGESLLKLVEPELESLGENWIAALKDHALLSLPPEFASQLPHGGGAFYSAETAEASRAHYANAWPALLLAATLRFNANTTTNTASSVPDNEIPDNDVDNKPSRTENGNCEFFEPIDERFHLLFGICMEALCAQRDMSTENTISVLLSLVTLLDAPENRARLLKNRALAIELCQIIHRTALTQESIEALLLAADVLNLIIEGAREQLHANMQAKIKELLPSGCETDSVSLPQSVLEAVHTLGEGGPLGDVRPGRSLAFAALELAVCLAARRLPTLAGTPTAPPGLVGAPRGLGPHADALLPKVLPAAAALPSLASPQGALSILPTLLHLGTEMLKECERDSAVAEAGILLLEQASECRTARLLDQTREQHALLLQSTLGKLVEMVKSDEKSQRVESVVGARAMAALIRGAAPAAPLHYPCINHFRQCLDTSDNEVFASCVSVLRGVWGGSEAGRWWARALAGRVLARAAAPAPRDPPHAAAARAALAALDDLLLAAPTQRGQLLWVLVPIVMSYLVPAGELPRAPPHIKALHEFALQWLGRIGPTYPQEFKQMMQQSSELRHRLEEAIRAGANRTRAPPPPVFQAPPARPAIQLKTDFSDFR